MKGLRLAASRLMPRFWTSKCLDLRLCLLKHWPLGWPWGGHPSTYFMLRHIEPRHFFYILRDNEPWGG